MNISQRTDKRKLSSSCLRQIGILLMFLAALIVAADIVYVFIDLPPSRTSHPPVSPIQSVTPVSPMHFYNSVTSIPPFLNDMLDGKQLAGWETYTNAQSGYVFKNGSLHGFMIAGDLPALIECALHNNVFSNFAFQVHMTILQGSQSFVGLFFRADQHRARTYRFYVDFYGDYNFTTERNDEPMGTNLSIFQPGLQTQKSLTLTVIALNTSFYLYLNQSYVRKVTDASYKSGEIGFFVTRGNADATDVAFSHAEVWKL